MINNLKDSSGNGETVIKATTLTIESTLEAVVEGLGQVQESLDELKAQQAEIIEKLNNLNLDNDGFEVYEDS